MPKVSDRVIEQLSPAYTYEDIASIRGFVNALVAGLEEPSTWAHDDPGYSLLVDPYRAPERSLPWLGQFVGVQFPSDMTPTIAERRQLIVDRPSWRRGSALFIEATVKRSLIGTKFLVITERYQDNAYRIRVRTDLPETPNQEQTRSDIESILPAGVILTFDVLTIPFPWEDLALDYGTWGDVISGFTNWQDVIDENPI